MKVTGRIFWCGLVVISLLLLTSFDPAAARAQSNSNHGGKIETTYDGFSHETLIKLQKMRVSCEGIKSTFKNACVSMSVSLHCLGVQAYKVNHVSMELMFETREWDQRHALDQRALSVVVNNETLRVGQMKLISQTVNDSMTETLGIEFPYETFKQMA
ncbi:MAG TPA: hypothetical protein VF251_05330, partial [Pyrinomonadaceae bacterium]